MECNFCGKKFDNNLKAGGHISWCKKNPNYERRKKQVGDNTMGRKLSILTKEKISKGRSEFLKKNPDQVPYRLYHSSKISYPEKKTYRIIK